ncbi:hypothetical protein FIU85_16305 [Roseovarius sp. THAF8]|uniref:hypothetical protein n=1 Tax=Roseovarius sp. THAF8 TaxID=2587846 RepID=UPI00126842D3|nr:hypothetical protein [Roseovarius sp. THAF8]QFT98879.1 hypothetical protein FIU85_16305 [Roseovarius sp. THAF8]
MKLLPRLLLILGLFQAAGAAGAEEGALSYLADLSERQGQWADHGVIEFPSGKVFFGDPTYGDGAHIKDPRAAPASTARLWTYSYDFIWQGDGSTGTQNGILWLEFSGKTPVRKGERVGFGADAAVIGFGDLNGGKALTALGERWQKAGKGDSFEFLQPFLLDGPYMFTRKVEIPQSDAAIYLVTTGTDGGFDAVWLYDATGDVSGILVDIAGRKSDRKFIDTLIPG